MQKSSQMIVRWMSLAFIFSVVSCGKLKKKSDDDVPSESSEYHQYIEYLKRWRLFYDPEGSHQVKIVTTKKNDKLIEKTEYIYDEKGEEVFQKETSYGESGKVSRIRTRKYESIGELKSKTERIEEEFGDDGSVKSRTEEISESEWALAEPYRSTTKSVKKKDGVVVREESETSTRDRKVSKVTENGVTKETVTEYQGESYTKTVDGKIVEKQECSEESLSCKIFVYENGDASKGVLVRSRKFADKFHFEEDVAGYGSLNRRSTEECRKERDVYICDDIVRNDKAEIIEKEEVRAAFVSLGAFTMGGKKMEQFVELIQSGGSEIFSNGKASYRASRVHTRNSKNLETKKIYKFQSLDSDYLSTTTTVTEYDLDGARPKKKEKIDETTRSGKSEKDVTITTYEY